MLLVGGLTRSDRLLWESCECNCGLKCNREWEWDVVFWGGGWLHRDCSGNLIAAAAITRPLFWKTRAVKTSLRKYGWQQASGREG